ncbi:hypothetical protein FIBSPDRAFT_574109 [Athelia psychrophila]|uniref:Uncharacterized protein n=1 Tax=Athelia psychrophila TaxID=1759441 RepID=A0A166HIU5_9AGAM|nr:hypothetical protein FIBSPDRAFT_574109 [Fibularhizoctonia sp. CBS 109695]
MAWSLRRGHGHGPHGPHGPCVSPDRMLCASAASALVAREIPIQTILDLNDLVTGECLFAALEHHLDRCGTRSANFPAFRRPETPRTRCHAQLPISHLLLVPPRLLVQGSKSFRSRVGGLEHLRNVYRNYCPSFPTRVANAFCLFIRVFSNSAAAARLYPRLILELRLARRAYRAPSKPIHSWAARWCDGTTLAFSTTHSFVDGGIVLSNRACYAKPDLSAVHFFLSMVE